MSIRYVIIEDEAPTLEELQFLLEPYDGLLCCGTAANGDLGYQLIKTEKPDIAFIDVNMPLINGVDLVKKLKYLEKLPLVVFTTAFREYAVEAFELSAFDYLLKPYDDSRIDKVIQRIRTHFCTRGESPTLVEKHDRLAATIGDRTRLISLDTIYYVSTDKEKIILYTHEGSFESVNALNEIADKTDLFRIHRGCLVNLDKIVEIYPWFNGTYQVKLSDPSSTALTVSRSFVKSLKKALL